MTTADLIASQGFMTEADLCALLNEAVLVRQRYDVAGQAGGLGAASCIIGLDIVGSYVLDGALAAECWRYTVLRKQLRTFHDAEQEGRLHAVVRPDIQHT